MWDVDPVFVRESQQGPVDIGVLREDICWEGLMRKLLLQHVLEVA
jgi:hypothetical protein